jgi:hypothetical protein
MKIAVLFICTGKYSIFWENFFRSSENYFLPGHEKHYFVFTDSVEIKASDKITVLHRTTRWFPLDSLMRFEMFLEIQDLLKEFDYIYFFNSNMKFVSPVFEEVIPENNNPQLVGVIHPGFYNKAPFWFPFERNIKSSAYIGSKLPEYKYYMGSLIGGSIDEFLKLSDECDKQIKTDLANNLMAIYHDESHLNKYFVSKDILELDPGYAFPEDWDLPFSAKIMVLNKVKHGGKEFDKLPHKAYLKRLKLKVKRIYQGIEWYLK